MYTLRTHATLLGLALLALPVAVQAQRGAGPRVGRGLGNPVAPLIDMRRELNLSARQLTQLDSIERSLLQRNRAVQERMRAGRDSVRPRGRQLTDEQRTQLRAHADSVRTLRQQIVRNDSTARAAAMRVLSDSQRVRVQVRQAQRRGFAQGRATAGARGLRQGRGGQPGVPRQQLQNGPRGRFGAQGQFGPRMAPPGAGMGAGRQFQGRRPPQGNGQFGPMGGQPGMRRQMGPQGGPPGPMGGGFRQGPPDGVGPVDGMGMRRRGMMPDSLPPEPPVRRPPADSGR